MVERDTARQPLSADEIRALLGGRPAIELYSPRSRRARELGIDPDALSNDELIELLAREPGLLRRPITILGDHVIIGLATDQLTALTEETN